MRAARRFQRATWLAAALHVLLLGVGSFEHHDLICHLKTPQHCVACASNPLASESRISTAPGACGLVDAGQIFAHHVLSEGALLAVGTNGRSPPSLD